MNKPKSNTGLIIGLSLVVLLIIAVIGFFMYKQFNPVHTSGDSCTPSSNEKVENAESDTYVYESDGKCIPTECVDKYDFDSSTLTCTKTKTGGSCTPSSAEEVENAESDTYQRDSRGDCDPTSCMSGYTFSKNPFACTTTGPSGGHKKGDTCNPKSSEKISKGAKYEYESDKTTCAATACTDGYDWSDPGGVATCSQPDVMFRLRNSRGACLDWTALDANGETYRYGNQKQRWTGMCMGAKKTIYIPPDGSLSIKNDMHHTSNWTIDEIKAIIPAGCHMIDSYGKGKHAYISAGDCH